MRRSRWILLAVLSAGCSEKTASDKAPAPAASATPTPTSTSTSTTGEPATTPVVPGLKPKEDALPKNESVAGSTVVGNDAFRFQVPASFKPSGDLAFAGTVTGAIDQATLTLSAASRKFKGDIDALVAAETKDATERGAKIDLTGPVLVWVGGKVEPARGRRLLVHFSDRLDYRVLVVRAPYAYVFHCETPATPEAWSNVGAACMARGNTFHVAPPH